MLTKDELFILLKSVDPETVRLPPLFIGFARNVEIEVAKRCAAIALTTVEVGQPDANGETKAYATASAIEDAFGVEWEG